MMTLGLGGKPSARAMFHLALFTWGGGVMKSLAKTMVLTLLVAGVATYSTGGASATQLVTNGGFESSIYSQSTLLSGTGQTPATDWTSNGTYVLFCTNPSNTCDNTSVITGGFALAGPLNGHNNGLSASPQGGNYMAFDSDPAFHGTFTQTIAGLTVGDSYTLSFYLAGAQEYVASGATTTSITATLGTETYSTPVISTPSDGFSGWQLYSTTFKFTGGGDVLSFLATGGPSGAPPYALLDGVSLTTSSGVPELSTWAMMFLGFAGLGIAGYRRRERASA